ncbi:MAG: TlpA family protein disulfide reductase [Clostridiales bacterium]|jgi:thiol-disulfide isomerase/thioredoxin|nr:TlpA family protein disulfide reductase [Clostridiales bacterium]
MKRKPAALILHVAMIIVLLGCAQTPATPVPVEPAPAPGVVMPEEIVTPPVCTQTAPPGYEEGAGDSIGTRYPRRLGATYFGEFSATDLSGDVYTHALFSQSALTMLNIWGTFCPPCREEMPSLGAISRAYDPNELQIVGIVTDVTDRSGNAVESQLALARDIAAELKADYVHLIPSPALIEIRLKDVMYIPETIFIDAYGDIVGEGIVGMRSKEEWEKIIAERLAEVRR